MNTKEDLTVQEREYFLKLSHAIKFLGLKKNWNKLIKWSRNLGETHHCITEEQARKVCQKMEIPYEHYRTWAIYMGFEIAYEYEGEINGDLSGTKFAYYTLL